jgi:hypothetical protein
VKGLLAELEGEIALVKQLPEIAQQVREIHEAVTAANAA